MPWVQLHPDPEHFARLVRIEHTNDPWCVGLSGHARCVGLRMAVAMDRLFGEGGA